MDLWLYGLLWLSSGSEFGGGEHRWLDRSSWKGELVVSGDPASDCELCGTVCSSVELLSSKCGVYCMDLLVIRVMSRGTVSRA